MEKLLNDLVLFIEDSEKQTIYLNKSYNPDESENQEILLLKFSG